MRILVTGVDGYIGAVLGPTLLKHGFDVVGLDCGFYRDGWLYNNLGPRPLTITKDVRRIDRSDLEGFDAVVHLAELSNDPLSELNESTTYDINHVGSVALARACKAAGVSRFIYTSSCSVYGAADDGMERTEESAPNPQTAYARCKVPRGTRRRGPCRCSLLSGLPAQRYRLWGEPAHAVRYRPEQFGWFGLDDQRDPNDQRRDTLAPACAREGHMPRNHALVDSATRRRPQ